MALADEKANTSQQEVLALVIDRETSNEVSRINREIGQSIYYHTPAHRFRRTSDWSRLTDEYGKAYDQEQVATALGKDASYEDMLVEYTQLKLYLHTLRKSCYWHGDPYAEREDVDVKGIMDRCDELRQVIKEKRRIVRYAAWGGMEPQKVSAYDKPLLYAFDDYTCPFITFDGEFETHECPMKGEHWYHGKPYCREHLGESRKRDKLARRAARHRRGRQLANCHEGCPVKGAHAHTWSGTEHF